LHYVLAVSPQTSVRLLEQEGRPQGEGLSVKALAFSIHERGGFRRCTWRKGTQEDLSARFALRQVVAAGVPQHQQEPLWLLIEWRDGELEPANYFLVCLPERRTKKQLIRLVMQRWRTERVYEDLKGELGLDHYEGRRFPGWHHHVSVALCCYAFIVAERVRRFPPAAPGAAQTYAHQLSA
jgi:SRSO17 transposase